MTSRSLTATADGSPIVLASNGGEAVVDVLVDAGGPVVYLSTRPFTVSASTSTPGAGWSGWVIANGQTLTIAVPPAGGGDDRAIIYARDSSRAGTAQMLAVPSPNSGRRSTRHVWVSVPTPNVVVQADLRPLLAPGSWGDVQPEGPGQFVAWTSVSESGVGGPPYPTLKVPAAELAAVNVITTATGGTTAGFREAV